LDGLAQHYGWSKAEVEQLTPAEANYLTMQINRRNRSK